MSEQQREIDFDRASKLRMLERVALAVERGRQTSAAATKAVLKVIDAHARDKPLAVLKIATIQVEAGHKTRSTTTRAIRELKRQCLLNVVPRRNGTGKRASEYRIVWSNLRDLVSLQDAPCNGASRPDRWRTMQHPMAHDAPSIETPLTKRRIEAPVVNRFDGKDSFFEESKPLALASSLCRKWATVLQPTGRADKDNLAKVAMLVAAGKIAENHPATIVESIVSPDRPQTVGRPMAYFLSSLRKRLEAEGVDLTNLMRRVDLSARVTT